MDKKLVLPVCAIALFSVVFMVPTVSAAIGINPGLIPIVPRQVDYIDVTLDPAEPEPDDRVLIDARYLVEVPECHLWIYVNGREVEQCEGCICRYMGGPYPDGFRYFVGYLDGAMREVETDEVQIDIGTPIELPDKDDDGILDDDDNCVDVKNHDQDDDDGDMVGDACDNCPDTANHDQKESDRKKVCQPGATPQQQYCSIQGDGFGDACDNCPAVQNKDQSDKDGDKWGDACDNCPDEANLDQDDFDDDGVGNKCDNCVWEANPDQNDTDTIRACITNAEGIGMCPPQDGVGDACDNCPDHYNPSGHEWDTDQMDDKDWDGFGDPCDNCPTAYNPDQKDSDNDGQPDGCDCDDGKMSLGEDGIDCGGVCPTACPACRPMVYNGDPADKINIVFVADVDYGSNMNKFKEDAFNLISEGYYKSAEISASKCKFNFWYHPQKGDYVGTCQKWDLPSTFSTDCPFADSAAIIFQGGDRACSADVFSAPDDNPVVVVHESGHKLFALADEYCCDGGYWQDLPLVNIYHSQAECQQSSSNAGTCRNFCPEAKCWPEDGDSASIAACEAYYKSEGRTDLYYVCSCERWADHFGVDKGLCKADDPNDCPQIFKDYWTTVGVPLNKLKVGTANWCNYRGSGSVDCCVDGGDGWWKSDSGDCTMKSGDVFRPDCSKKVKSILGDLPACLNMPIEIDWAKLAMRKEKVVILDFDLVNDSVVHRKVKVSYGIPPKAFNFGEFGIIGRSSDGKNLSISGMRDPMWGRLSNVTDFDVGWMRSGKGNFSVVVPMDYGIKSVDILDWRTGEVLETADVSDEVDDFCKGRESEEGCSPGAVPETPGPVVPGVEPITGPPAPETGGQGGLDGIIIGLVVVAGALGIGMLLKFKIMKPGGAKPINPVTEGNERK